MFRGLRAKLIIFFVCLLAAGQFFTFLAARIVVKRNHENQDIVELNRAATAIATRLARQDRQLLVTARSLARDSLVTQTLAGSQPTRTALRELIRSRMGKDHRLLLVTDDGRVLFDSDNTGTAESFPATSLSRVGSGFTAFWDNAIYRFAAVPVSAAADSRLILALRLSERQLQRLDEMAASYLDYVLAAEDEAAGWRPVSSTVEASLAAGIVDRLRTATDAGKPLSIDIDSSRYLVSAIPLAALPGTPRVTLTLVHSMPQTEAIYQPMDLWITILSSIGLVAVMGGGLIVAQRIIRPVHELVEAARRIQGGNYLEPVRTRAGHELGQLVDAFNAMMAGIAEREERIAYQAAHDAVTGLPNRWYFERHVDRVIRGVDSPAGDLAIVIVRIDQLDEINKLLGHDFGDQLFVAAADRLSTLVETIGAITDEEEPSTNIVAVHGDDVFALMLAEISAERALLEAARIVRDFEQPFTINGISVDASVHLGISCYPAHGRAAKELVQKAELALHEACDAAERTAFYTGHDEDDSQRNLSLMGELRQGLERGEFELYFQPKIDLKSGQVTHVEALARWRHPVNGFMPPDKFVPLAEQTGYIGKITRWALLAAIEQCAAWRNMGLGLSVCVNLSARDLTASDLSQMICRALEDHELDPGAIILEITESALMQDPHIALRLLNELSYVGLKLAIDDFGTGQSSMTYLKRFPVYELKIDKSFITDMLNNPEDDVIVRSTIQLAHNLGLVVTAEGVEDKETVARLAGYGCDLVQGYVFSRPLPVTELMAELESGRLSAPMAAPVSGKDTSASEPGRA